MNSFSGGATFSWRTLYIKHRFVWIIRFSKMIHLYFTKKKKKPDNDGIIRLSYHESLENFFI